MPTVEVLPNKVYFSNYIKKQGFNQKGLANFLDVSEGTAFKLLHGIEVRRKTIADVARKLQRPISSLIVMPEEFILPDDPAFYESMRYGYYLDHDRGPDGRINWYDETLDLKRDPKVKGPWRTFDGTMTNSRYGSFLLKASLLNRSQFVLAAVGSDGDTGFVSAFSTWCHPVEQPDAKVLCGTWMGTDHALTRIAIFRMFLSPVQLDQKTLYQLTTANTVEPILEDHYQASRPKAPRKRKVPKKPGGTVS